MNIEIDFAEPKRLYRLQHGGGKQQAIAKAIGIKKAPYPTVIDATAGLGKDALVLAALGCQVTMIERHPDVALALKQAIQNARQHNTLQSTIERLNLVQGIAQAVIPTLAKADVIYLDPMFPPRAKSALVKQDLRDLHQVVGADYNNEDLVTLALQYARKRVVVKRPKTAPTLSTIPPSYQLIGSSNRFDIYLCEPI